MFRAIAEGNWRKPLDLTIPSTWEGELKVPFPTFVRNKDWTVSETVFPQYTRLPAELQLRILQLCDQPSLFELMHTSRHIRAEAQKLFFSEPNTWYRVEADWLLAGGHAGETIHDMSFLACAKQVYVEFDWMTERTWMDEESLEHWVGTEEEALATGYGGTDERMQNFWRTVQRCLPQVNHIVVGDDHDRSDYHDGQLPTGLYRKVGEMCPREIRVSVDLLRGDGSTNNRLKRAMWQLAIAQGAVSTKASQAWKSCQRLTQPNVVPPKKPFHGPVGRFLEYDTLSKDIQEQKRAIRVHRIIAVERLHFNWTHKSFTCASSGCHLQFQQPEEYTTHVIPTKHDKRLNEKQELPEYLERLFTRNDERLDELARLRVEKERSLIAWWGQKGSAQRYDAVKESLHQLEYDPLYAQDKPVSEHKVIQQMSYLDKIICKIMEDEAWSEPVRCFGWHRWPV
ncbi:hypothetical protein E8E13_008267 [Curvularia kusanoi]|uniref:F-box domain-containing protein n=1 Tax=Curvularia kusanoi TaxID=90978 RepID=A0A9P4T987_CURKU|nr:hypothetical protein E8E13_008267 [Curvularia kusanoi]